jgi:hypothetical protein
VGNSRNAREVIPLLSMALYSIMPILKRVLLPPNGKSFSSFTVIAIYPVK